MDGYSKVGGELRISKLFPHPLGPPTDTPGILFIEVAQVARISELVEALLGPEPGEAGEEAVELLAPLVGGPAAFSVSIAPSAPRSRPDTSPAEEGRSR